MRYWASAVIVGAAWYVVLLPFGRGLPLGGPDWLGKLAMMCGASLTVAITFRRAIASAAGLRFHMLAAGLPALCSVVFGLYLVGYLWAATQFEPNQSLSAGILWMPLYCLVFGAVLLFPVTLPMGYLSQWLMQRAARPHSIVQE